MIALRKSNARFPITSISAATARQFVEQWCQSYKYTADELYTSNIGRKLTAESIHALFLWKNGGELSSAKHASVERQYASRYKN